MSKKYKVEYTRGNLNNHIGVPMTLLSITKDIEIAVVEMGANHPGEIQDLVEIAEPTLSLFLLYFQNFQNPVNALCLHW